MEAYWFHRAGRGKWPTKYQDVSSAGSFGITERAVVKCKGTTCDVT